MRQSRDGIWIIDREAKTVFVNQRMAEILGSTTEQLMGRNSLDYVFTEDRGAAQKLFEAKRRGDSTVFSFKLKREDGSAVSVHVQGTPMHDTSGLFIGVVGTFRVDPAE